MRTLAMLVLLVALPTLVVAQQQPVDKPPPVPGAEAQWPLIEQIIKLKNAITPGMPEETVAAIIARIEDLERELQALQSVVPLPPDPVPPVKPDAPPANMDPVESDLIAKIVLLKNTVGPNTSAEEFSVIMAQIDALQKELQALQAARATPSVPSQPDKPDPTPPPPANMDPVRADLIAKIVILKNRIGPNTSAEEVAGIMLQIEDLEKQLRALESAWAPPPPPPPPGVFSPNNDWAVGGNRAVENGPLPSNARKSPPGNLQLRNNRAPAALNGRAILNSRNARSWRNNSLSNSGNAAVGRNANQTRWNNNGFPRSFAP
jgi:hypothetical protein